MLQSLGANVAEFEVGTSDSNEEITKEEALLMYQRMVKAFAMDGKISEDTLEQLAENRRLYNLTDEDHVETLSILNISAKEWEKLCMKGAKKNVDHQTKHQAELLLKSHLKVTEKKTEEKLNGLKEKRKRDAKNIASVSFFCCPTHLRKAGAGTRGVLNISIAA